MLNSVKNGTWKTGSTWNGLAEGVVDLSPMGDMVPDAVKATVMARRDEIKKGNYVVFSGPVLDQSGTVRLADATPDDGALLSMDWFVKGVIGTTE